MCVKHPRPGATVVELLGEHDLAGKERCQRLLGRLVATNDLVVVDVTETQFIDSSVIATLFESTRMARQWGTTFRVQMGTATSVKRALEVSGILQVVDVAGSREEALAR